MRLGDMRQPAWLIHAWAELGQREIAGPKSNPRIDDFIRTAGHPQVANDATAWCAAFVGACLERAGIAGTRSLMARSYLGWGQAITEPQPGDIAVLSRGANPTLGHVGFLVGLTNESVILLGGNQSDAVTVEAFARNRLLGVRRPSNPANVSPRPLASAASAFPWSLARILEHEGGYSDDAFDPGGPTNKGITLATYAAFTGQSLDASQRERLKGELRVIPDEIVTLIYRERYWRAAHCPALPASLAHFHFDAAVNQGVNGAARMLQEALGVSIDGQIGPITLAAVSRLPVHETLKRYADIRRRRYRALGHFWRFGRGWLARVDKSLAQALSLDKGHSAATVGDPPPHVDSLPFTQRKDTVLMPESQNPTVAAPAPGSKWWGNSLTIWGTLITAVSTVAPAVLSAFGVHIPGPLIEQLGSDVVAVAQAVGGLVGTIMTVVGRTRAALPLTRRPVSIRV
jgi:uncharacterized protein (TIGR02594 family)